MNRERRNDWLCRAGLLCVWLVVWTPRLSGPIDLRWDASTYYVLGTALAEGKGYRLLNEPGEIHAVQYPPLLPLIIAAHEHVLGTTNYFEVGSALRRSYFLFSGLFLLAAYQLARRMLPPMYSLLVGVITALSFNSFLELSDVLYAEIPFGVVVLSFLLLQQRPETWPVALLKAILAGAAYLLRTAGLALIVAWIAESLFRRRFRQALGRAAACAVPILFWQLHVYKVIRSADYRHPVYSYQRAAYNYPNVSYSENSRLVDPFRPELGQASGRDVVERIARNMSAIPRSLGESAVVRGSFAPFISKQLARLFHVPGPRAQRIIISTCLSLCLIATGLFALAGAVLVGKGDHWFLSLYLAITLFAIVLTPWQNQFWRYLGPVAPVTLIFVFRTLFAVRAGVSEHLASWKHSAGLLATTIPPVLMLLAQVFVAAHLFRSMGAVSYYKTNGDERVFKLIDYGPEWHALDAPFEWLRRNAESKAVVATTVPQLAYLRTGHKAVLPPFATNRDNASRLLDEVPVKYLIVDRFGQPGISERYAAPVVEARPRNWKLVFSAPEGKAAVYERTH